MANYDHDNEDEVVNLYQIQKHRKQQIPLESQGLKVNMGNNQVPMEKIEDMQIEDWG